MSINVFKKHLGKKSHSVMELFKCGHLRQMFPWRRRVVRLLVFLRPAKMAKRIEVLFGVETPETLCWAGFRFSHRFDAASSDNFGHSFESTLFCEQFVFDSMRVVDVLVLSSKTFKTRGQSNLAKAVSYPHSKCSYTLQQVNFPPLTGPVPLL